MDLWHWYRRKGLVYREKGKCMEIRLITYVED